MHKTLFFLYDSNFFNGNGDKNYKNKIAVKIL